MKATKDFKMKSSTKVSLALGKFNSEHDRAAWKRAMIDAQLCEEKARKDNQRAKSKTNNADE